MQRRLLCYGAPVLLLIGACQPASEARARELFPNRSRTLATERQFRRPTGVPVDERPGACPHVLQDNQSGTSLRLRGWADVEERRRDGSTITVARWQKGYYVPANPAAVGLAVGEEYAVRCDRMAGVEVNVPDFQIGSGGPIAR